MSPEGRCIMRSYYILLYGLYYSVQFNLLYLILYLSLTVVLFIKENRTSDENCIARKEICDKL